LLSSRPKKIGCSECLAEPTKVNILAKISFKNHLRSKAFENISPDILKNQLDPQHPTEESFLCHIHLQTGPQNCEILAEMSTSCPSSRGVLIID
jgi:hypothetical protein